MIWCPPVCECSNILARSGLASLGDCSAALEDWDRAERYQRAAIELADVISFAQTQSEARLGLAKTQLFAGNAAAAQQAIIDARDHPFPPTQADIALVTGIIGLRNDDPTAAGNAFRDALTRADHASHCQPPHPGPEITPSRSAHIR